MSWRWPRIVMLASSLAASACVAPTSGDRQQTDLSSYRPLQTVRGDIRVWGSPADRALLESWEAGFRRYHPDAHLRLSLHGPESTMAGVYNGVADIAFMAREMRLPVESMAFEWVYRYKPFSIEVANAGLSGERPSTALAVYVNTRNPLARLTLTQLDAILGADPRRGTGTIRQWGQLGLGAKWGDQPIVVYGPTVDSIAALFVKKEVLRGSDKWNPDYREIPGDDAAILAALARDPTGIAYAAAGATQANVKVLSLAASDSGPFYLPTRTTIAERRYPLGRTVTMVLNRAPGAALAPELAEFLRYVLSREGQDRVARNSVYIPLSAASVSQQLARLE